MPAGLRTLMRALAVLSGAAALAVAGVLWLDRAEPLDEAPAEAQAATPDATQLERGRVLALAGNCVACHSARGGVPYAGGRALGTPFGTVYAGNLTPDAETGLGRWTPAQFWRALHHGRGADGRRLVPAFPYTETTRITRSDSDALYAWLRTLPAVVQQNRPHELRWPYGSELALAAWRVLFFRPGEWQAVAAQTPEWNRGAYLVNGAGHCVACHGGRNALGATADAGFGGGLVPTRNWYAPAFTRAAEASVADWPRDDIVALLRDGRSGRGQASGPMAEVVSRSTQYLPLADLQAMAQYLQSIPVRPDAGPAPVRDPAQAARLVAQGDVIYRDHCAGCHGTQGEGGVLASGERVVPPLAGNRMVAQEPPTNLVRAIALGGFAAVTAAHPRPFGMPPFAHVLSEQQIAVVATFVRRSWGAAAAPVGVAEVARWRGGSDE